MLSLLLLSAFQLGRALGWFCLHLCCLGLLRVRSCSALLALGTLLTKALNYLSFPYRPLRFFTLSPFPSMRFMFHGFSCSFNASACLMCSCFYPVSYSFQ